MKKLVLLFGLLVLDNCYSQNGWFWQNPLPQGNKIYSLSFPTSQIGFAGTDGGVMVKTTDGGNIWKPLSQNSSITLYCMSFFDNYIGIAGGGLNIQIARTTDGGISWSYQNYGNYDEIVSLQILNDSLACAGTYSGKIFETTNRGLTWNLLSSTNFSATISSWFFISPVIAYLTVSGNIHKTTNSGANWIQVFNGNNNYSLNSIAFVNQNTGLVAGFRNNFGSSILRTSTGGTSWDTIYTGTQNVLNSIRFLDVNNVFIVGSTNILTNAIILRSTNSGLNWNVQDSYTKDNLLAIATSGTNILFTGGEYGKLLKYINGGSNWSIISSGFPNGMNDIWFLNSNTGYALANKQFYENYARLVKTTNGGINWISSDINTSYLLTGMSFIDVNTGVVVGFNSTILRTTNGGVNWINMSQGWLVDLEDVFFLNATTGFTVANTRIYKTTDAAVSWSMQTLSFDEDRIYFPNIDTGFIVTFYGSVLKTTNTGGNWVIQSNAGTILRTLHFTNGNTGWIAGNQILKTTNGGSNWQLQFNPSPSTINCISFLNSNTGYAVGSEGIILFTTNGGANWFRQISYTGGWLTGVTFTNQSYGWVVGYDGIILHTTDGGFTVVKREETHVPASFVLYQNYPNPFNPVTKIKFDVSSNLTLSGAKGLMVKLKIYDILSSEITTLVNEQLNPGTYEVQWDATNYPSGIYFYKLSAGDFTESKKMILIK